ncbi:MAG: dicarboxylate/amino acid:cation symporter [Clostridiales bacterium]|nr:dicarboxylate/amino acid:cation symporter [Clostridiales bacterium]
MDGEKKKIGLTTKIFVGLVFGILLGMIIHFVIPDPSEKNLLIHLLYIIGNGFLRGMQMLVVPLVFCSLVTGSMAIGDTGHLGKVGVKTLLFYLVTTAIAITLSLSVAGWINPGLGLDLSSVPTVEVAAAERPSFADTVLNIIPVNPIAAFAEGNMLQIIFFALITGVLLAQLGDKVDFVSNFFSQCNELMMAMTVAVMKVAPIGVFCLTAKTFAGIGFSALLPMIKYIAAVFVALSLQCFFVYMVMLKIFTGFSPIIFMKKFMPVMGFAFSTATSNATVPLSIETLWKRIGVSKKISSFTIPLGATINMDGTAIMQGAAVIFVAQAFGISLDLQDYFTVITTSTLSSIGTAGVPGVGLITLSMVFASIGLPVEGIGMIMGIDRIVDMARTAVNVTGDAVCTTIVAYQDKFVDRTVFEKKSNMEEEEDF